MNKKTVTIKNIDTELLSQAEDFNLTDFTLHENATQKWLYGKWEIECHTGDIYFGTWQLDHRIGQYIDNGIQIIWFQDTLLVGDKYKQIHRQLSNLIEINANKACDQL